MDCDRPLLILDDEPAYLEMLSNVMSLHLSCPIVTYSRPQSALEALETIEVGAVATDYFMPQMNGLEFIRKARSLAPGVPFIIITGHGPELEQVDLTGLPELRCVLNKPFRWTILAQEVVKHWHGEAKPEVREL